MGKLCRTNFPIFSHFEIKIGQFWEKYKFSSKLSHYFPSVFYSVFDAYISHIWGCKKIGSFAADASILAVNSAKDFFWPRRGGGTTVYHSRNYNNVLKKIIWKL